MLDHPVDAPAADDVCDPRPQGVRRAEHRLQDVRCLLRPKQMRGVLCLRLTQSLDRALDNHETVLRVRHQLHVRGLHVLPQSAQHAHLAGDGVFDPIDDRVPRERAWRQGREVQVGDWDCNRHVALAAMPEPPLLLGGVYHEDMPLPVPMPRRRGPRRALAQDLALESPVVSTLRLVVRHRRQHRRRRRRRRRRRCWRRWRTTSRSVDTTGDSSARSCARARRGPRRRGIGTGRGISSW
mmetsp:Transcript_67648/g.207222  ORF Transcript_67648/g.207222 Transcript_67648/m.207222 type:complete len:239 (+) Transcript_67648:169-885(+)